MDIIYSSTTLLNIRQLTVVNGNTYYQFEINDSPHFISTMQSTEFIAMKHAGNIHIFNVKKDREFPEEFKDYIGQIAQKLRTYFNERTDVSTSFAISDEINRNNPHNFAVIRQKMSLRNPPIVVDLQPAKHIIAQLNGELQKTCPDFYLNIDYITSFPQDSTASLYSDVMLNSYFQPPLVLCLFTGNDCVSSLTLKIKESELTIDSRTNERYEGRKFNTLLRAVAIMISKSLNAGAERLVSSALNIVSTILMIKRFNAVSEGGDISSKTVPPEKLDKVIKDYYEHRGGMETHVELNEENIANATTVFHETIPRMNCAPLVGGLKRMDIVFSSVTSDLLNIHPLTTVNGNICYEIRTSDGLIRYMFTPQSTTFIATKHDDVIHIFNLKQDRVFPDEFKEYIEQIRGTLNEFFEDSITIIKSTILWRDINDNSHNFAIIHKCSECKPLIDLSNAKRIVARLSDALQQPCPGFHLHIDYITSFPADSVVSLYSDIPLNSYFQPQIVLCLFTGNDCVSSITINVTRTEITIDSKTNELYEGRKFNTLLRAVVIIISKILNERAKILVSIATNAISALLMIKRFNAVLRDGNISSKTVSPEKLHQVVKDYIRQHALMETCVELNEDNVANATTVFHATITRMNCAPLAGGRTRKPRKPRKPRKQRNPNKSMKSKKTRKQRH
jgi:hypothetical protein